mgnify:CR=1 FL=1
MSSPAISGTAEREEKIEKEKIRKGAEEFYSLEKGIVIYNNIYYALSKK